MASRLLQLFARKKTTEEIEPVDLKSRMPQTTDVATFRQGTPRAQLIEAKPHDPLAHWRSSPHLAVPTEPDEDDTTEALVEAWDAGEEVELIDDIDMTVEDFEEAVDESTEAIIDSDETWIVLWLDSGEQTACAIHRDVVTEDWRSWGETWRGACTVCIARLEDQHPDALGYVYGPEGEPANDEA